MDINDMKDGQVMVLYNDLIKSDISEFDMKLLKNKVLILRVNKTIGNVDMIIQDTIISDSEYEGTLNKETIITLIKALKGMYRQL